MFALLRTVVDDVADAFNATTMDGREAMHAVHELGRARHVLDGLLAQAAKRVDDDVVNLPTGEHDGAQAVAKTLGVTKNEARRAIATSKELENLPATARAVREGRLSAKQAELIAGAASVNPEAEQKLLETAADGLSPLRDACVQARAEVEDPKERRKRLHKQRSFRMWTDAEGMLAGSFRLTPEVGGQIKMAIDEEVKRIFRRKRSGEEHEPHDAYAADAFVTFVLEPRSRANVRHTVHVVIDHAVLTSGTVRKGERCEIPGVGPVDPDWVREIFGEAFLTLIVRRGKDITTVAHVGRHIRAELRTALLVEGRECVVEGCNGRGYLEIDHRHDFAKGGPTKRSNLDYLCAPHHDRKSKGWQLGAADPRTRKRKLRPPPARAA